VVTTDLVKVKEVATEAQAEEVQVAVAGDATAVVLE